MRRGWGQFVNNVNDISSTLISFKINDVGNAKDAC